uniref:Uncharacterized protein n=1 Tax=Romanomermis culicivorax TaxID=13658 RepID=A0A915JTZ4_ROMCU
MSGGRHQEGQKSDVPKNMRKMQHENDELVKECRKHVYHQNLTRYKFADKSSTECSSDQNADIFVKRQIA